MALWQVMPTVYQLPGAAAVTAAPGWDTTQMPAIPAGTHTAPNRWADSDSGAGVSGQNNNVVGNLQPIFNGNKLPVGGPAGCPWTTNNCGPNNEPFSLHVGGLHSLMGDGGVRFISENVDRNTARLLFGRADGGTVGDF